MKIPPLLRRRAPRPSEEMPLSREDVVGAFRALLGRDPEAETAIAFHRRHGSIGELYTALAKSSEYIAKSKSNPLFHFNGSLDAAAIIRSHENPERRARAGHVVNFLGVAMNTRFIAGTESRAGVVEEPPIPENYHADMAEWAAALRAVDLARRSFVVVELGCGWGCWMVNTSVAARRRGLTTFAIGVEGDPHYLEFAREALATNGIAPECHELHRGVAAAAAGMALFPKADGSGDDWGFEPIFGADPETRRRALASGTHEEIPHVALAEAIGARPRVDLLHMDIQGGEARLIEECVALLDAKVAYLVVATHSRQIEGRVMETLLRAGWVLEIERPAIFSVGKEGPVTRTDGVQGWRNPKLVATPAR
jgi:FkbM family methyltransferase